MDIGTAVVVSYSANLVLYVTITICSKIKKYVVEKYYN
jgi:hypothetical protein